MRPPFWKMVFAHKSFILQTEIKYLELHIKGKNMFEGLVNTCQKYKIPDVKITFLKSAFQ